MDGHGGSKPLPPQEARPPEARVVDVDGARAKELYKYFTPSHFNAIGTSKSTTPDTVLTAHVQLVAWRLGTNRAMISLIDRETQYFIAESTKTLHLDDPSRYEDAADALWAGCISVPMAGRLCEYTLQASPPNSGGPAYFEVCDLSQDARFKNLPFVRGGPQFRYYVGVPIRTKKGIAIGSLFAMDTKPCESINSANRHFLGVMADNVMTHLEMLREREDRKRAFDMNMCLAAFVDPKNNQDTKRRSRGSATLMTQNQLQGTMLTIQESGLLISGAMGESNAGRPQRTADPTENTDATATQKTIDSTGNDSTVTDSDSIPANEEDENHINTFKRAANLLYSSLALENGGGVVFLDDFRINTGFSASDSPRPNTIRRESTLNSPSDRLGCEVLAAVSSDDTTTSSSSKRSSPFTPLSPSDLTALIKRYPRGKLLTLDTDSTYSSTSSGEERVFSPEARRSNRRRLQNRADATFLSGHFPTARQVIFVPIWDAISGRWSACFVYNCCEFRTINHATEFLYCIAFCNCVATEISKLASINADQQKQNFIGSISHELRSPLHGILGSMEFLSDTDCTSFQHSLIDTANSCAVTLLDTIQQILDFSKVNAFERNTNRLARGRKSGYESGRSSLLHHHLNIYGIVDLAAVTEEVIEGVATGQEFRDITKLDSSELDPINSRRRVATHASVLQEGMRQGLTDGGTGNGRNSNVEIVLDIRPRASWLFVTQPGAFRRIVMNLFGNALKYTQKGYIKVKLDASELPEEPGQAFERTESGAMITLIVEDSGQGISPQFLRSKLFTPFAQENSLNPGTGLGLSLVKQIVSMLNGEIKVNSALGVGTEVIVQIPMADDSRPLSAANSASTPSSAGSMVDRSRDESLQVVQQLARSKTVALYGKTRPQPERNPRDSWASQQACLWRYFSDWYRFSSVTEWNSSVETDVIVVDEQELQPFLDVRPRSTRSKASLIIVICANSSRHASMKTYGGAGPMEFVSVPLGPYKLARGLKLGFDKIASMPPPSKQDLNLSQRDSKSIDATMEPVSRVTLNSDDTDAPDIQVIQQGAILGAEDSTNAQMAMGTRSLSSEESTIAPLPGEFPFPSLASPPTTEEAKPAESQPAQSQSRPVRPSLEKRRTISATKPEFLYQPISPSPMSSIGTRTNAQGGFIDAETELAVSTRSPRLLLVDDNKVNLRLLQTFMKKRAYTNVHSAEDGQQAVSIFHSLIQQNPPEPPDIILMDISMPVLDGFAATRQIRKIEADVANTQPPMQTPAPSLIIALTGLASSRDQSEAFVSGFDLYMTKPVSFKEVGRLLDNWQANGGAARPGVPHGPVTEHTELSS